MVSKINDNNTLKLHFKPLWHIFFNFMVNFRTIFPKNKDGLCFAFMIHESLMYDRNHWYDNFILQNLFIQ